MRFEDRGATLIRMVRQLPQLKSLSILYQCWMFGQERRVDDNDGLPRCKELAELRSHSLTRLSMSMLAGSAEGSTLRLNGLPELRTCELFGDNGPPNMQLAMRIDAASFQGAPQLQSFSVCCDEALQLQDSSLRQLTSLTSLTLRGCGLQSVPAEAVALSNTLSLLNLSNNSRLQIDGAALATILQFGRLRSLSLYKSVFNTWDEKLLEDGAWRSAWGRVERHMEEEGYTPSQFSLDSWRVLMQLPSAYSKRHGRELDLWLDVDDYFKSECYRERTSS